LGVLQESGPEPAINGAAHRHAPRLGRPGQLLQLDNRRPRFVVMELGVKYTRLAALPVAVPLQDDWTFEFPTPPTPQAWIAQCQTLAARVPPRELWGVLISVPGIVDESAGKVLFSPNLHWLEQVDLPQLVGRIWRVPVLLLQEIRALAFGHLTTALRGEDFFLVDFGQGVGGAIVLEGKLYTPPMPLSGEVGHTPVPGNKRRCGCGAVGCLETLVSERGLLESWSAARPRQRRERSVATWPGLVADIKARGIEPWLEQALQATAQVIAGALNVLGLHRVVITGLLAELPGCVEFLGRELNRGSMWGRFGKVICQAAPRRRAAGLVGTGLDRLVLPVHGRRELLLQKPK
jgi:predicted NBD/HSP70 family sugar kinase